MITEIRTTDDVLIWTPDYVTGFGILDDWNHENNNSRADTQGFMIKIQIGEVRVKAKVTIKDTKTNIETYILPLLTYPTSIKVTFDRNIIGKTTTQATFAITDYQIVEEFDNGEERQVQMILTEVLG